MKIETHDVPEHARQTLELIHERQQLDMERLLRMRQELDNAYRAMERRYAQNADRLARSLGIEVPDGALIEGDIEHWTLSVRSGKPGGGCDE